MSDKCIKRRFFASFFAPRCICEEASLHFFSSLASPCWPREMWDEKLQTRTQSPGTQNHNISSHQSPSMTRITDAPNAVKEPFFSPLSFGKERRSDAGKLARKQSYNYRVVPPRPLPSSRACDQSEGERSRRTSERSRKMRFFAIQDSFIPSKTTRRERQG